MDEFQTLCVHAIASFPINRNQIGNCTTYTAVGKLTSKSLQNCHIWCVMGKSACSKNTSVVAISVLSIDLWPSWSSSETKMFCLSSFFARFPVLDFKIMQSWLRWKMCNFLSSPTTLYVLEGLRVDPMISWLRNFKAIGRSKNFDNMMKKHAMACTLCKNWAFQQNLLSPAKKIAFKRSDLQSKITTNTTSS